MTSATAETISEFRQFALPVPEAIFPGIPGSLDLARIGGVILPDTIQVSSETDIPSTEFTPSQPVAAELQQSESTHDSRKPSYRHRAALAAVGIAALGMCLMGEDSSEVDCTHISKNDSRNIKFDPPGKLVVRTKSGSTSMGWFKLKDGELLHSNTGKAGSYSAIKSTSTGSITVNAHGGSRPTVRCPK